VAAELAEQGAADLIKAAKADEPPTEGKRAEESEQTEDSGQTEESERAEDEQRSESVHQEDERDE
jgi:hypothetical protein